MKINDAAGNCALSAIPGRVIALISKAFSFFGERRRRLARLARGELSEIARFEKDGWHKTLFMFGTIHFPYGSVANSAPPELYFHLVGVREDNRVFRLYRANGQNSSSGPQ